MPLFMIERLTHGSRSARASRYRRCSSNGNGQSSATPRTTTVLRSCHGSSRRDTAVRLLLGEGRRELSHRALCRSRPRSPLLSTAGRGILFGESGDEAVRREFREELGIELGAVAFLGFIENLFVMGSERYHELCLIFGAEPDGWSLERFHAFEIHESIGETAIVIEAQNIEGVTPFYPDGVETLARRFMNTSNE